MALHYQLRSLVEQLGYRVLEDSDSLRAALDDYLDEGAASRGEINLLVDAVRLGGFRRLAEMTEGGADPSAAVLSAGDALARERGSADVAGARWAIAALGFAAGRVPEGEVQRWDPSTASAPQPPQQPYQPGPTNAPPTQQLGQGSPYTTGPGQPYQQPGQQPPYQQSGQSGPQYGAPGYGYGDQPPPKKKSKAPLLIAAAVLVVLALVGGGIAWALSGDDEDDGGGGGESGGYDEAAYCEAYRAADDEFSSMDLSALDGQQFEDLQDKISELEGLSPPEVQDEWETLSAAFTELENILGDAGLTFDDLDEIAAGQLPPDLDASELQALSEELTEFSESTEFQTAGDAIDVDAEERCGVPTDGGSS